MGLKPCEIRGLVELLTTLKSYMTNKHVFITTEQLLIKHTIHSDL